MQLNVALQDGFTGEEVVIRVDGEEVRRVAAQTAWEISLATSFDVSVDEGSHTVEIEIPARGVNSTHLVDVSEAVWVGISVMDATEVVWRVSTEPFGYV
jgi:hypothetical protein